MAQQGALMIDDGRSSTHTIRPGIDPADPEQHSEIQFKHTHTANHPGYRGLQLRLCCLLPPRAFNFGLYPPGSLQLLDNLNLVLISCQLHLLAELDVLDDRTSIQTTNMLHTVWI
jgi:hypothetical protein